MLSRISVRSFAFRSLHFLATVIIVSGTCARAQSMSPPATSLPSRLSRNASGQRDPLAIALLSKSLAKLDLASNSHLTSSFSVGASCVRTRTGATSSVRWYRKASFWRIDAGPSGTTRIELGPSGAFRVSAKTTTPLEGKVAYMVQPFFLPGAVLLSALTNTRFGLAQSSGADDVTGAIHVRVIDAEQTEYPELAQTDWYFDPVTYLPTEVRYFLPSTSDLHRVIDARLRFTSFGRIGNTTTALTVQETLAGIEASTCTITTLDQTGSLSDEFFAEGIAQ